MCHLYATFQFSGSILSQARHAYHSDSSGSSSSRLSPASSSLQHANEVSGAVSSGGSSSDYLDVDALAAAMFRQQRPTHHRVLSGDNTRRRIRTDSHSINGNSNSSSSNSGMSISSDEDVAVEGEE